RAARDGALCRPADGDGRCGGHLRCAGPPLHAGAARLSPEHQGAPAPASGHTGVDPSAGRRLAGLPVRAAVPLSCAAVRGAGDRAPGPVAGARGDMPEAAPRPGAGFAHGGASMSAERALVEVHRLRKDYASRSRAGGTMRAVDGVDLTIERGETL